VEHARRFGFRLEELHARLLRCLLHRENGGRVSLAPLLRRYRALGTTFPRVPSLPLNLP
jgi:hypothetical protein